MQPGHGNEVSKLSNEVVLVRVIESSLPVN